MIKLEYRTDIFTVSVTEIQDFFETFLLWIILDVKQALLGQTAAKFGNNITRLGNGSIK